MKKFLDLFLRGKIRNSLLAGFIILAFALIIVTSAAGYYLLNKVSADAGSITWIIAVAAILVMIFFLPVVILAARKISYPLEVLAEGADEISRGNYGFTLDLSSNHEINILAQSFNRMSTKLKEQREVLLKQISLLEAQKQEIAAQNEELAEANARLELIAITDQLTGAYNRRYIMREIEQELAISIRHGLPLSITMIDIDHFKEINDTHGHQVGDEVLKEVVQVLSSSMRTSDLLGRYGGEEFIVIAPLTAHHEALVLAERLRETVSKWPFETTYGFLKLTISLGVATYDGKTEAYPSTLLEQLLARADAELYKAKSSGRNCISPVYIEERAAVTS
ncbi:GGDEF domain-containing protein [Pelotomaculum propionicicum]|uniref:GGDEF domain-containing protein n=1 Tax=Pelotomaculum propionicicum TaxID=258475 RepID=UPI003B760214